MRRLAKASPTAPTASTGTTRARKSLFGVACACVLSLVAFAGSGAPAAGAAAGECPNEQFRTGPGALLPDCRAYEQVSPVDKNGGDITFGSSVQSEGGGTVALNGTRAIFTSLTEFAGSTTGGTQGATKYLARRGAGGWETVPVVPGVVPAAAGAEAILSTPDLGRTLLRSTGVLASTPPHTDPGEMNIYLRDNAADSISPLLGISSGAALGNFGLPVVSPDLEHVVFTSPAILTADPGVPGTFALKTYEKVGEQPVRLVAFQPDGTAFPSDSFPAGAPGSFQEPFSTVGGVSDDGQHVFFSAEGSVYRRSNGTTTALASPSKSTVPDPQGAKPKLFKYATPDGNRLLFTSAQQLTDDANTGPSRAGADLYRYDFVADELTDISATLGGDGARVEGVVGFDENAERVYYVAKGQVVPGEGTEGQANLYLWEDDGSPDGQTRFIASLLPRLNESEPGDSSNWHGLEGHWTARTSPEGRYLLFQSEAAIPGHEGGGVRQVYRYDAATNGGAGQLDCVSCNPAEETPIGPSFVTDHIYDETVQRWELPRALASDGRVFFTSQDDLLANDTNGLNDAYTWKDGELDLLSTGTSSRNSYFYNASVDGSDAFIITAEALVPQDGDDLMDLYTARVSGGLAPQFATPPPGCTGEECRGASPVPDPGSPPLSSSFEGNGNPPPTPRPCPKGKRKVKARGGKTRCVKKPQRNRNKQNRANSNRRASR